MKNHDRANLGEEAKAPRPVSLSYGFAVLCAAIALKQNYA
jgi:hypothetical protein